MDNHIFRSAALGFNRQDVMEYIEKTQKEAEANAASLTRRLDEAMEELAQLRLRLEERGEEADHLEEELAEIRRQYDQEKADREALAQESARQGEAIRALTEERDRLSGQVDRLNSRIHDLHPPYPPYTGIAGQDTANHNWPAVF